MFPRDSRFLAACLVFAGLAAVGQARAARIVQLHSSRSVELIKGEKVEVEDDVVVLFRTGHDSYNKLRPEAIPGLVADLAVAAPPGLKAEVIDRSALPTQVEVGMGVESAGYRKMRYKYGTGEGYVLRVKLRLSAEAGLAPGKHTVKVAFPAVVRIARQSKGLWADQLASCTFDVTVWASREARAAAIRAQQERQEAEAARKQRRTYTILTLVAGGVVVLIVLAVFRGRKARRAPANYLAARDAAAIASLEAMLAPRPGQTIR
jgi:hypothetical protein